MCCLAAIFRVHFPDSAWLIGLVAGFVNIAFTVVGFSEYYRAKPTTTAVEVGLKEAL